MTAGRIHDFMGDAAPVGIEELRAAEREAQRLTEIIIATRQKLEDGERGTALSILQKALPSAPPRAWFDHTGGSAA